MLPLAIWPGFHFSSPGLEVCDLRGSEDIVQEEETVPIERSFLGVGNGIGGIGFSVGHRVE